MNAPEYAQTDSVYPRCQTCGTVMLGGTHSPTCTDSRHKGRYVVLNVSTPASRDRDEIRRLNALLKWHGIKS